jgi:hypothetical protein
MRFRRLRGYHVDRVSAAHFARCEPFDPSGRICCIRVRRATPCCAYRELNPAVLMMKSAEDRLSSELAEPLDRPMTRGILTQG